MEKKTQKKPKKLIMASRALLVIIGGIITGYGLEAVLIPNAVSDGGLLV